MKVRVTNNYWLVREIEHTVGRLLCPYLITPDFLSLHDFTNRLPILRFIIVCIGLEKVLCNNLPNSSQPTYHLTFLHNVRSTIPIIQGSVRLTIIPCSLLPFLPPSLPPFLPSSLPMFKLIFREAIGSIRSFPIRLGVYDPPCSQRSPKHHPPLAKKDRIWVRVRFNNTSFY